MPCRFRSASRLYHRPFDPRSLEFVVCELLGVGPSVARGCGHYFADLPPEMLARDALQLDQAQGSGVVLVQSVCPPKDTVSPRNPTANGVTRAPFRFLASEIMRVP